MNNKQNSNIYLSVIVPAYKTEKFIAKSIITLRETAEKITPDYEIIIVSDGNKDKTFTVAQKFASQRIKIIHYQKNMGKGYALKYGARHAKGRLIAFIDADMNILPEGIGFFLELMKANNADIIVGSKRHLGSKINYSYLRRFQSRIFQAFIRILFNLGVKDTQAGIKLFRREVILKALPLSRINRFAFDLELLVIAKKVGYNKILEAPIEVRTQISSTVNFKTAVDTLFETLKIFYFLKIAKYYDRQL